MGHDDPRRLEHWGILVSSRFLGRSSLAVALDRFRTDGVWGVSPHLIPHFALHSPSGTLSLALGIHGPNLGVGGGLWSEFEGILTALTWLQANIVPCLWLVLSGWSPELIPDREGEPVSHCECQALALVLGPLRSARLDRPRVRVVAVEPPVSPQPLHLHALACLLDERTRSNVRTKRISRNRVVHTGHGDHWIPRPHFADQVQGPVRSRPISSDASRRFRVELLLPPSPRIKEAG
jgi:hypothetical protein